MGFVLLVYLFVFSLMPAFVFWSPDEGAKFIQLQTLRRDGGLRYRIPYPGRRLDPTYSFYPHRLDPAHTFYPQSVLYPRPVAGGQVYFNWPIWFPLISILPFSLFGVTGLYFIPLVSGLLTVALSGWIAWRLLPAAAPLTIVTVGLATPIFFYSLLFWEHTLAVLIGLAALGPAMQMSRNKWWALISSLFLVSAVLLRVEMILYALALLLASGLAWLIHYRPQFSLQINFKRWDRLLIAGLAGMALILFFSLLNPVQEGWLGQKEKDVIEQGLSRLNDPNLLGSLPYRLQEIWINTSLEVGPELPALLGRLGLAGLVLSGLALVCRGRGTRIWLLAGGGLLVGVGSAYALFSPQRYRAIHSLLLPAPHLVFAVLFVAYVRYERRFEVTLVAVATLLYLVLGSIVAIFGVRGGLEWGARYLLMAYPLAAISTVVGLHHFYRTYPARWNKRLLLGLAVLLFLIGGQYELRGVREIQTTKKDLMAYQDIVAATRQPVVTDLYWLPAALATRFIEQEIYTLAQREDLYTWLDLAGEQIDSFLFVSFTPLETDLIQQAPYPLMPRGEQIVRDMTFAEFEVLSAAASQEEAQ